MNVDGIERLMVRRESGDLTDVQYLDESKRVIMAMPTRSAEEEVEKQALLEYLESLRARALYWENREIESLADEVETWLCEPSV